MNQKYKPIHLHLALILAKAGLLFLAVLLAVGCRSQLPQVSSEPFQETVVVRAASHMMGESLGEFHRH